MDNMGTKEVITEDIRETEGAEILCNEAIQESEELQDENLLKKGRRLERRKDTAKKNLDKKEKLKNSTKGSDKRNFVKKTSTKNFRRSTNVVGSERGLHKKLANKKEHVS